MIIMNNNLLLNICNDFKNNTNIKKNYLEYISALLYLKFYNEKRYTAIFNENHNAETPNIIDNEIKELEKSINNSNLFSNIKFKSLYIKNNILTNITKDLLKITSKKEAAKYYQNALEEITKENDIIHNRNEFYTPLSLTNLLCKLTNSSAKNVYDPFCGTGNFILSANKKDSIGIENNINIYNICMTNLFLNDIDNSHIYLTEQNSAKTYYDLILSNPPFSQKDWHKTLPQETINYVNSFHLPSTAVADYAYVLQMFEKLTPNGKMAVILPHGALFRQNEIPVRKKLITENFIEAVISLPPKLFYNNKIAIVALILSKNKKEKKTIFIDASKDYISNKKNNELTVDIQNKIISTFQNFEEISYYSHLASLEEIEANNFNLSINKYVKEEKKPETIINKKNLQNNITELEIKKNIISENTQNIVANLDKSTPKKPLKIAQVVGLNIKYYRTKNNITQKELADYLNTNKSYLSYIENGHANISLEYLYYICKKLNIDIIDLFK